MRRRPHSASPDAGMTLIELIVVMGIIGVLAVAAPYGLSRVRKTDLRYDAGKLASALRSAFDRAATTGAHHRVAIDLDGGTYRIERCQGKVKLYRTVDEAEAAEQAQRAAEQKVIAQGQVDVDPLTQAAGDSVAGGGCAPIKAGAGRLKQNRGLKIARVFVAHLTDPVEKGTVTVNFFPLGQAERAVIELADEDSNVFTLLVHPLSGRVQLVSGEYARPEEWIGRDDTGEAVEP